ncbi:MAG: DUF4340 domain-containing protein [Sulfuriflexus sp.]|nr:DUF4340 domain-containing protein [Sulfuriflexus sp.]
MNARLLLNLSLLVGVIAIGVFIANSPDKNEADIIRLGGPDISEIKNIFIQSDGLADIQLQQTTDNNWLMTQPYKVKANSTPINEILKLTKAISHSRFSAVGKNLRDYDLQPARASLHFNDDEYVFGNIEHINKRRYLLKDNTIHLVTDLFYHRLRTNTESFISPQLVPDDVKITSLKLPELELNKSAQGEWMISGNKSSKNNIPTDAIQTLLDHWQHKRAIQILPAKPTDSTKEIFITFSDDSKIRFTLVQSNKELILIRADLGFQYHLPVSAANDLLTLAGSNATK